MKTMLMEMLRNYEEHCDRLINNGFEPNETILNKIAEIKRKIKLIDDAEDN